MKKLLLVFLLVLMISSIAWGQIFRCYQDDKLFLINLDYIVFIEIGKPITNDDGTNNWPITLSSHFKQINLILTTEEKDFLFELYYLNH
ncbi:hypothetical protein [Atribacter laminatus]|uniref:Uncharacterized protein n=1 Tax=Atribacter laminatus TaxID=2847778 RepID=A0A7T1AMY2_ATRLM|nr:hypothetical protein [Atribacter laminatus]QPM68876.1 hypothetical protein RT761_02103 [Atribacter laminatus]